MTVFETPALRATSSTAKSGPASRTASTAAATRSSLRARRCSVHRARRPSGCGVAASGGAATAGGTATGCMCFTVTATFLHSHTRRSGEPADDRHTAVHRHRPPRARRRSTGRHSPPACSARRRRSPTTRSSTSTGPPRSLPALRSVTGMVDPLRHAAVGWAERGAAGHAHHPRVLLDLRRRHLVRVPADAAHPARHLRRRPRAAARAVGADRDRRRVPALGHVRPDGGDVRRAVLPAAEAHPAARQGVRGQGRRSGRLRGDPGRRGDPRHLPARPDEGRAGPAADPRDQPDPRRGGGAAHALRPRGGRPPDARAVGLAAAQAPHRRRRGGRDRRGEPRAAGGLRVRRAGPARRRRRRPGPTSTTRPSCATRRPAWWRSCAASGLIGGPSERLWNARSGSSEGTPARPRRVSSGRAGSRRGRSRPRRRG